jgi:hypothetical protein
MFGENLDARVLTAAVAVARRAAGGASPVSRAHEGILAGWKTRQDGAG